MFTLAVRSALAIGLLAAALGRSALACSCLPPETPIEATKAADVVFVGKVVAVERHSVPGDSDFMLRMKLLFGGTADFGADDRIVTLTPSTPIKGNVGSNVIVRTPWHESMCGYPFERGETYLVYATFVRGHLETGLCSRCASAEAAHDEIAKLLRASL